MEWRKRAVNLSDEHKEFVAMLARSGFYGRSVEAALEELLTTKAREISCRNIAPVLEISSNSEYKNQFRVSISDAVFDIMSKHWAKLDDAMAQVIEEKKKSLTEPSPPARRGLTKDKATLTR